MKKRIGKLMLGMLGLGAALSVGSAAKAQISGPPPTSRVNRPCTRGPCRG
jgi:hypothetical protein